MKYLRSILAISAAIVIASLAAQAHQQINDDEDGDTDGGKVAAWSVLANTAGARAAALSNAPRSQAPCVNGMAAGLYPCDGVDMLSFIPIGDLGSIFVNDMWGWTDPQTGKDYALLGAAEGVFAIDVSDPRRPAVLGLLPTATTGRIFWRDIKVFADHAFIVSEDPGHGMQVLDLGVLRDIDASAGRATLSEAARYTGFGSAHNVAINEDTGFAYAVGTQTCAGGLHMVDINNPTAPAGAGCFDGHGYIHDTQCVTYRGPDADHQGKEICINAASNFIGRDANGTSMFRTEVTVSDVTDKAAPAEISKTRYGTNYGYSHQGWLMPDQAHYIHGDELDEARGIVENTVTRVWDMSDLDAPALIAETTNGTTSIDHNLYTRGNYAYASNYTSGLRVFDTRNIAGGEYREIAWFDMYPENDNATFEGGTWSNYAYFSKTGVVAVSSMDRGMFLLKVRGIGGE